jgi:WhiB family redox-sensing transcriptional regulator
VSDDGQRTALPSALRWVAPPALFDPQRPDWQHEGACLGHDPDIWFPERGQDYQRAKLICHECPVRTECLEWALATEQKFGIWGGASERERRAMRAQRRRAS